MSNDKTLATVKRGGCVQLPTSERERFEAWASAYGFPVAKTDGLYHSYTTATAWLAWQQAALSAQPSPGGQGDALASLPLYRLADDANGNRGLHRDDTGSWVKLQDVERALAARQPAGVTFPWENFPAYLIDKCEGDTISEEGLQQALAAMANDERYRIVTRQPVGLVAATTLCSKSSVQSTPKNWNDHWDDHQPVARSIIEEFVQCADVGRPSGKLLAQARDYLAAHQPVGENPAWRDELVREAYNRGLADGMNADRQPVGELVAVRVTPEMRAAFRKAYREGGFWHDRLDTALDAMMRAARQPAGNEPAFYLSAGAWGHIRVPMTPTRDVKAFRHGFDHGDTELVPFYAAPTVQQPAQAVDLGAMPDGWRLSKKATCYQLSRGNDIIGNLVGPDAEENAAIIARVLDSQAAAHG